ncbi:MAG TPA: XisI protein [Blastocatellia bacterium]|nr:XisI protein [Blastocatellia bacterium]
METVKQKTEKYRQIIQEYLTRFAAIPNLESGVKDRILFDQQNNSYAIIAEGWDGEERVHFIVAHLEIIDGKIWIQADNTDVVIARELEAAGVPKADIVLGFRPPSIRALTEYAAA